MKVHHVGVDSERRQEAAVERWVSKIEKSLQMTQIPLEASGYPEKVQMYWDGLEITK